MEGMAQEAVQDVNPVESSPAETPQASEPTLNAGNEPVEKPHETHVPYERFQEVNNKYSEARQILESQEIKAIQQFQQALESDPRLAEQIKTAVQSYYAKASQPNPDPYAQYPQEIADPLRKTHILEQQVQQLVQMQQQAQQQATYQKYIGRFNEKVSAMNLPEPWKNFYQQQVELRAMMMNPNALQGYDQNLIDKAFDMVDREMKALQRTERSQYIADKKNDTIPASTSATGSPAQVGMKLQSTQEKASYLADVLRAANQG